MISVLIVDDEYLIRKLVRNSIEWDALQMEVVGEAENGEEAIQFLQRNQVDIAIVDINMPFVNGVGFAEYVYRNHLQTKVILLTGYREFEYAQQAIRWKVVGYLLKPLQIPEMERTLREIVSTYYRNKRKLSPGEMEQAQLREYANNLSEELPESCARLSPFFARLDRPTANVNKPTRPMYITADIQTLATSPICSVTPMVSPTVPKADTTSYSTKEEPISSGRNRVSTIWESTIGTKARISAA